MRKKLQLLLHVLILLLYRGLDTRGQPLDQLSSRLKPEKYKLKIKVAMGPQTDEYSGSVLIKVNCEENTKSIVVNQNGLQIYPSSVWVRPFSESTEKIPGLEIDGQEQLDHDKYEIRLMNELERNKSYEIKIKFSRKFPLRPMSKESGFLIIYDYFATTKINELDARNVFPCLDQVNMKAQFKIILKHCNIAKGLTNADLSSTIYPKNQPQWIIEEFEETDSLSTFSLAIVLIGPEWPYKESIVSSSSVDIRVRTYPYKKISQDSAGVHEIWCNVLKYYTKIFSLPYSLGKLDVVIAEYISMGAKGNYGLIFMSSSEASLILDQDEYVEKNLKYEVFSKLCRTISQQWIGNIVTMSNWYENWWFEGFNDFFQVQCVDEFRPEFQDRFSVLPMINSFIDLLEMARMGRYNEISLIRKNPNFSLNKFNEITKIKINCLVRMMDFFLGRDIFNESINKYLERFKFLNSKIDDIWNTFTETATSVDAEMSEVEIREKDAKKTQILPDSFTIKQIMESWTTRNDIPLLTVSRTEDHNTLTVKQEGLQLLHGYEYEDEKNEDRLGKTRKGSWSIPLSFTTQGESNFEDAVVREWLTCNTGLLTVRLPHSYENIWYMLNMEMKVPVRINYDEENWLLIQNSLINDENYSKISVIARTQLVSDLFVLAEIGRVSYSIVLNTMKYLSRETEYAPWKVALKEFKKIRILLMRTEFLEPFEAYVRQILEPVFEKEEYEIRFDFVFKDRMKFQFELLFIELSCIFDMSACSRSSEYIRQTWENRPHEEFSALIPRHINEMVHCQLVKYGDKKYWSRLRNRYRNEMKRHSTDEDEASIIFTALGCAKSSGTLKSYLKLGIDKSYISKQDSYKVFRSLISNIKGYRIMKKFLKSNLNQIEKFYNKESFDKSWYFEVLLEVTNSETDLKDLMKFAEKSKKIDMNLRRFRAAEEKAKYNIQWLKDSEEVLRNYFNVPKRKKSRFFN